MNSRHTQQPWEDTMCARPARWRFRLEEVLRCLLLLVTSHSSPTAVQAAPHPTGELIVFAAASLTEPFTEIGTRLEASYPGLKVIYNFGGSPALRMQLEQGAQADVFASADTVQMERAKQS